MGYQHIEHCPPAEKQILPCRVYRILIGEEPADEDFLSYADLGRGSEPKVAEKACRWHGISLFSEIEGAYQHIDLFDSGPIVAAADLDESHGVVARTPSAKFESHLTWWPSDGLDRREAFKCV